MNYIHWFVRDIVTHPLPWHSSNSRAGVVNHCMLVKEAPCVMSFKNFNNMPWTNYNRKLFEYFCMCCHCPLRWNIWIEPRGSEHQLKCILCGYFWQHTSIWNFDNVTMPNEYWSRETNVLRVNYNIKRTTDLIFMKVDPGLILSGALGCWLKSVPMVISCRRTQLTEFQWPLH